MTRDRGTTEGPEKGNEGPMSPSGDVPVETTGDAAASATSSAAETSVEDAVRQHYMAASLRPELLERLRAQAELSAHLGEGASRARWLRRAVVGAAVAAALALAVISLRPGDSGHLVGDEARALLIAEEIALNHRKGLAVEFPTDGYSELTQRMEKLDFAPRPMTRENAVHDYHLVGARYCSIQGAIAAQLKLTDDSGEVHTLYETRWKDSYRDVTDREIALGDVKVRFWRDGEVLFGLASSRGSPQR